MTGEAFTVALAQTDCVLGDVPANVAAALDVILQAREGGADLIAFPELSLTGYDLTDNTADAAMEADDPLLLELAEAAGDMGVVVGFAERSAETLHNSAAYLCGGTIVHVHRKVYLPTYGLYDEGAWFSSGDALRAFDTPFGRMGIAVCNDAWHPEVAYVMAHDGARVLIVPACSSLGRHPGAPGDYSRDWLWICRFYARFFACYVVFVNRVGSEGPRQFWGGSLLVGPDGNIVAKAPRHETSLTIAQVDLDRVEHERRLLPLLNEAHQPLVTREIERVSSETHGPSS